MAGRQDSGMKIKDILQRGLVAISESAKVASALELLKRSGVPLLPVLEKNRLVGMISEEDLIKHAKESVTVRSIMSPPIYCTMEEPLESAIKLTINSKMPRIPVVDNDVNMNCVGVVSASDITSHIKKR